MKRSLFLRLWLTLAAGGLLVGCASDKTFFSHALNNIAARDNAFFLAREKLWATEATLYKGRVDDYNRVLPLYPTLDSGTVRASRADLNDVIKKASMPIQHRPGSDWTDDAYLIVGWARYYKMEFDDAILTFKYVNSTSKDPTAKQEALIGLMRSFLITKQLDNAKAVSDLLEKETGLARDARELFLARADYYLQANEPKQAIQQLERAVPLIPAKNERSRTRFLLAQLYHDQGQDKEAAAQLNQILRRNPPYELDFQAKLLLGQVSDLGDPKNKARLDQYFAKLLKDPKNKEYRDKIYYEMGRVQYRQQRYPEALALLRQAAKVPSPSRSQKGYTYLLAGRIYYENLQKYPLAAAYYDSTVQALPKDNPLYASVQERAGFLKEFAKNYVIIQTQDSLQALARLPAAELDARLTRYATAALEEKRKAEEKALAAQKAREKQQQAQAAQAGLGGGGNSSFGSAQPSALSGTQRDISDFNPANAVAGGALWYFDNPGTLSTARADFVRVWGDRRLQDNWRTVRTPATQQPGGAVAQTGDPATGGPGGAAGASGAGGKSGDAPADPQAAQRALVAQYRQELPDTPAKLAASDKLIEEAMYKLGGIYKELLKETQRGYDTYATQVARYPRGLNAPDAYYLLYLYYQELPDPAKAAQYAAALQREFPNSNYAKFIADPNYREKELALHRAVSARLDAAFELYKDQYFTKAKAAVAELEKAYPQHDQLDRVAYLKLLLAIRTQPPVAVRASLAQFAKDFPDSPLSAQARALAASYQKADTGQLAGALASTEKPVVSQFRPGEVDNRVRILYDGADPLAPQALGPNPTNAPGAPTPKQPAAPATDQPADAKQPAPTPSQPTDAGQPAATPLPSANPPANARPLPAPRAALKPRGRVLSKRELAAQARANAAPAEATAAGAVPNGTNPAGATPGTAQPGAASGAPGAAPAGATPAGAAPAGTSPATPAPAVTPSTPAASGALTPAGSTNTPAPTAAPATTGNAPTPTAASAAPAAPAVAYAAELAAPHAVVVLYPAGQAPVANLPGLLATYHAKYFGANRLTTAPPQALGSQEVLVVQALPDAKAARTYATRLRGPQSPLGRLRGQGYQVLVISLGNLARLQQSGGDVAGYQQFYLRAYPQ